MRTLVSLLLAASLISLTTPPLVSAEVTMLDRPASADLSGKHKPRRQGPPLATGSQGLVDNSNFKWFINTNITFSTSSSASGAMSEASYQSPVAATTLNGGTVMSALNDAYDGYNTLCLSLNNTVAFCETGNANFVIYNKLGPPTTECSGRQIVFPVQTHGSVLIQRKVFVPSNDAFARWLNIFTNNGGSPTTITMVIANNLGSDSNTKIVTSSNGNNVAEVTDTWVTTFQNYSGTTSSDPRLGHIFQGPGGAVSLAGIHFADGDDNPFWGYTLTLQPGQTRIIANFAVAQPSKSAAAAKAAQVEALPPNTQQCLSPTELAAIVNFTPPAPPTPPAAIPTLSEWGVLVMAALLVATAGWRLRRRARAA
jgi:hypothetical protein